MIALAHHTFRECFRRPFPYVAAAVIAAVAFASYLFQAFSFGAHELETANLLISAVFLAGLAHAAFQGTALVRTDIERGTLGLVLTKPLGLPAYLAGRLTGLIRAFLKTKGTVLNIALNDVETLKKAQQSPEEYRNLRVRMGGWSAYFVLLDKRNQDHHIARYSH